MTPRATRFLRHLPLAFALVPFVVAAPEVAGQASPAKGSSPAPIAVQDHEVGGIEVALLEVKRQTDNSITVKWQYRNTTNVKQKLEHGFSVGTDNYRFARKETYLVDTAKETKYSVLEDTEGNPAAAKHGQFQFGVALAPKQSVTTWAKFAGVPPDLKTVTVYVPGPPPFEDVPISGKS